jgi:hypothetical protein
MNRIILIIFCFVSVSSSAQLRSAGTGSGSIVYSTSPTLVTPNLGTPTTLVATNATGTAAGLTAGNVTTNANLTGDVTSSGNATTIGALKVTTGMLAANAATLAKLDASNATANKVLMSGASASPTWSTPTFPNASATSRKIIVSDGTNWTASTELWPIATTSGNTLISDGTNWVTTATRSNWTSLVVSGSNYTNATTSLTDITGLVSGTLATATLYEFNATLYVNSSSTAGMQIAVDQTGGGTGQIGVWSGDATSATATAISIASNALAQSGAACVLVNGDGVITIRGFIKTGSSGSPTIKIRALKTTSGTATVYIGSVMRFRVAN